MKYFWLSTLAVLGLLTPAHGQADTNAPAGFQWGSGIKVLMVTGGYFHDYDRWFVQEDSATLNKVGITSINSTKDPVVAGRELPHADVMILSANTREFDKPEFRAAVPAFIDAGKGLVLVHSGIWYNWGWTELNTKVISHLSRDHDGESQFTETIVKQHPVVDGLPPSFTMTDELYHPAPEPPDPAPIDVLAQAAHTGGPIYPSVWITHYKNARIVCIALGHDGNTHTSPYYQKLLQNAVKWAAGQ
jgi:type 1 glutamine amidotransferase